MVWLQDYLRVEYGLLEVVSAGLESQRKSTWYDVTSIVVEISRDIFIHFEFGRMLFLFLVNTFIQSRRHIAGRHR